MSRSKKTSGKKKKANLRLYKTIFEARYKPELVFYERLFSAAKKLDGYEDWITDGLKLSLQDLENYCSVTITHKGLIYVQDTDKNEEPEKNIEAAIKHLAESFQIDSYLRLGYRKKYLLETTHDFEELTKILYLKLFPQDSESKNLVPGKVQDLAYVIDSKEDDIQFHLKFGPVRANEIRARVAFNEELHFRGEKGKKNFGDVIKKFPDVALFFDIDMYRVLDEITKNEAFPFIRDASERIDTILDNYITYFFAKN